MSGVGVGAGVCAYCKKSSRAANVECPYNLTAHAQYVEATTAAPSQSDDDDSTLLPILAGMVAAEVVSDPAPSYDSGSSDTGGTFEGFGGGDSGGGGASDSF